MAISFVATRATTGTAATATTVTIATSTAIQINNILVIAAKLSGGNTVSSITDARTNNWIRGAYNQTTGADIDIWYQYVTTPYLAGDLITVTASAGTNQIVNVVLLEFSGLSRDFGSVLDTNQSPGTTAAPASATTKTMALSATTKWKDLVIAGVATGGAVSQTFTYNTGNGWTGVTSTGPSAILQLGLQWKIQTAVGTESTTISWTGSQPYGYAMAAFYPRNSFAGMMGVGT